MQTSSQAGLRRCPQSLQAVSTGLCPRVQGRAQGCLPRFIQGRVQHRVQGAMLACSKDRLHRDSQEAVPNLPQARMQGNS